MNITINIPVTNSNMSFLKHRASTSAKRYIGGRGLTVKKVECVGYYAGVYDERLTFVVRVRDITLLDSDPPFSVVITYTRVVGSKGWTKARVEQMSA